MAPECFKKACKVGNTSQANARVALVWEVSRYSSCLALPQLWLTYIVVPRTVVWWATQFFNVLKVGDTRILHRTGPEQTADAQSKKD